jgi:branched-chain amino acid transport system ATP-binding protein
METRTPILEVSQLNLQFGGVQALSDVSFELYDGEILAIIGPNGAGKTSLLNCNNGFYKPSQGTSIRFHGEEISGNRVYENARRGIGRVFQGIQTYAGMTTLDNLMTGRHLALDYGLLSALVYFGLGARKKEMENRRQVEEIIKFLEIESIRKKYVGELSYGMRKRVDLGRALALEPRLMLLDEPMAGMNLEEKEDIARFVLDISEVRKMSMVLVEHDMDVVMNIAHRIVVLDFGKKIAEGTPEKISRNPAVISAYLGEERDAGAAG